MIIGDYQRDLPKSKRQNMVKIISIMGIGLLIGGMLWKIVDLEKRLNSIETATAGLFETAMPKWVEEGHGQPDYYMYTAVEVNQKIILAKNELRAALNQQIQLVNQKIYKVQTDIALIQQTIRQINYVNYEQDAAIQTALLKMDDFQTRDQIQIMIKGFQAKINSGMSQIDVKLNTVQNYLDKKPSFEDLAVTPNLLTDTKEFKQFGKQSMTWEVYFWNTESQQKELAGSGTAMEALVTSLTDQQVVEKLGLKDEDPKNPWGDLQNVQGIDKFSVIIFELKNWNLQRQIHFMDQGCYESNFDFPIQSNTQYSLFAKILEYDDELELNFFDAIKVSKNTDSITKRWTHLSAVKQGINNCHKSYTSGTGRVRVAVALPYIGSGNSANGAPVWADRFPGELKSGNNVNMAEYQIPIEDLTI